MFATRKHSSTLLLTKDWFFLITTTNIDFFMSSFTSSFDDLMTRRTSMTLMTDGRASMPTRERESTGTNTGRTMTGMACMFLNLIMVTMRGFLAKLLAGRIERSSEVLAGDLH